MEEFTRYGDEWKKKMNKWTKTRLIEMCAKIGKQNEKLEAMIEELISAKGIKELEARLAEAEREACAKTIELIIGVDVGWEDADTIRVAAKAIRNRGD